MSKLGVIIVVCIGIIGVLFLFAVYKYPVPSGDAFFFLEPAVHFSKDGSLNNYLFINKEEMNTVIDPTGKERFLWYPPLFPMIVGSLIRSGTPQDIFLVVALIHALVIAGSAFVFYRISRDKRSEKIILPESVEEVPLGNPSTGSGNKLSWGIVIAIALGLTALVSSFDLGTGRPEILARLWLVLGLLVYFFMSDGVKKDIIYGILLGLLFATHPMGGVIATFILLCTYAVRHKTRQLLIRFVNIGAIGLAVAFLVIAAGPYGIGETIRGTFGNAIAVSEGVERELSSWHTLPNVINYYFLSQSTPFYGLVVILLLAAALLLISRCVTALLYKNLAEPDGASQSKNLARFCACFYTKVQLRSEPIQSRVVFCLALLGLLVILGKIIYTIGHVFYISLFAPLIITSFIYVYTKYGLSWKIAIVLVLLLVSTGITRTAILFPFYISEGKNFESAEARFDEIVSKEGDSESRLIGLTSGFWLLGSDFKKVYMIANGEKPKQGTSVIFFQQRYNNALIPPDIEGCSLKESTFSTSTPSLFGVVIGNTMPGYSYAVYGCNTKQK